MKSHSVSGWLVLLALAVPGLALAHVGGFLKIEGIEGNAAEPDHKGWVELLSFSWEDLREVDERGGVTTGVTTPTSGPGVLVVTKKAANEIPGLKALCGDKEAKVGTVDFSHPRMSMPRVFQPRAREHVRDAYPPYIAFRLKGVIVPKCVHVPGAEGEAYWLRFDDIEWLNVEPPPPPPTAGG